MLFVCTGNIHRSAMGAAFLVSAADPSRPLVVRSAGTRAVVGAAMGEFSAQVVNELGADASRHIARQLTASMAQEADLILVAGQRHRERVLRETPLAMRRVFLLREYARLSSHLAPAPTADYPAPGSGPDTRSDVAQLRARIAAVAALRGQVPPAEESEDIADPVQRDLRFTRTVAVEILDCVTAVVDSLGLKTPID